MQVHIKTKINAPAEKVWQILAHQFDDIATWSSIVNESRRLSAGEIPAGFTPAPSAPVLGRETVSPALKAKEIITHYSEEKMELTFEAADLPPIMTYADDSLPYRKYVRENQGEREKSKRSGRSKLSKYSK